MSGKLRVACVQANPTVGDIAGNLGIVRRHREAFRGRADLVAFSECFVSGYPLGDLVSRPGFLRDVRKALDAFAAEMEGDGGPAVLIGAPREGAARPFNAAFLIDTDGSIQATLKRHLPNEQVYDEKRTFAEGPAPAPLSFMGWRIGVPICEDYWHGDLVRDLVDGGAEFLIVPNGSHYADGKQEIRFGLARSYARLLGVPGIYVNQVGGQDETVFDGASFACDRHGHCGIRAAAFREASFVVEIERGEHGVEIRASADDRFSNPGLEAYPGGDEAVYSALVLGLRDYVRKSGFTGVVLGKSGGLDSALSAAVAVDALGPENVLLVRMPSPYTSGASMDDARAVSDLLGTRMETIPIGPAMDAFRGMLSPLFEREGRSAEDATEENLQARARGVTLMALSNKLGLMLLTTGNKSEMSVGYATLYGDMCGGFSVLKDVYKTAAFRLCRWRNAFAPHGALGPPGPVMPVCIIEKPPSAELREGQTDEAALGSYDVLDAVLRQLTEGMASPERADASAGAELRAAAMAAAASGDPAGRAAAEEAASRIAVDPAYAVRIARMVRLAQYKRRQAPPGVVTGARDYGLDYRFPIAGSYEL